MYTTFIADDELIIRQGLRCILDWEELGFQIIGEAANGADALDFIIKNNPDLVLLDIRMPQILGTEIVRRAKEQGFTGKFIILSGFTDFEYTQAAIHYGVDYYLTKPIDEDALLETVKNIALQLDTSKHQQEMFLEYKRKAHDMILHDILTGQDIPTAPDNFDYYPKADCYQVIIYEKYNHNAERITYRFSDLLMVTNEDNNSYEAITIDGNEVLLLKGTFILQKFQDFLERYEREQKPQTNSPLDSLFIT